VPASRPVLCSECFSDHGLRLDASRLGITNAIPCRNCGSRQGRKLTRYLVTVLASQFFVRGSVHRARYGSAPMVQFNDLRYRKGDYVGPTWMARDLELISDAALIGFFHYGPRLWMIGHVEPLEALQDASRRDAIIARIVTEYPSRSWKRGTMLYRLRANPERPSASAEYDSPPDQFLGRGRLDSSNTPVLYCSQDIEGCVHECRVTVEDELYLATLIPSRDLKLLDLTALLEEQERVDEFDSLDMAVHMLFYAAEHSYPISRAIVAAARKAGFDGLLYPSYFGQVRSGAMPYETVLGISVRRFPGAAKRAQSEVFPNVALFGRPIAEGTLELACINRLVLHLARYDVRFGPVRDDARW
jgi:hypothetical protein